MHWYNAIFSKDYKMKLKSNTHFYLLCCIHIVYYYSLTIGHRIMKSAVKVIGTDVKDLKSICEKFMNNKLSAIRDDVTHPLNKYITVSRSGRL